MCTNKLWKIYKFSSPMKLESICLGKYLPQVLYGQCGLVSNLTVWTTNYPLTKQFLIGKHNFLTLFSSMG